MLLKSISYYYLDVLRW